jgi:hypothetical protein
LELYQSSKPADVLVVYDEAYEGSDRIRRRACFLEANTRRIEAWRKPRFVMPAAARYGMLIPVLPAAGDSAPPPTAEALHAVVSTDHRFFTLHSGERNPGTFMLPVYPDASGRVKLVLLTPLALVADATTVGGFAFLVAYPASAEAVSAATR